MADSPARYPLWTRGDLDGFFGLMVDNLVQVLLIVNLCKFVAGLPEEIIYQRILPGVAISLLVGNVFYGIQAHYVARRYTNPNCTALPFGINTPSVFAYVLFIMGPVYRATGNGEMAWQAGLLACLVSGAIELSGAFVAERLRRATPRAALLGVLAAVGITFIAADFAFRIYALPLVGILPLAILLLAYFAHYRFPFGLPGGFLAILIGTAIAWTSSLLGFEWFGAIKMSASAVVASAHDIGWIQPRFWGVEIWELLFAPKGKDLLIGFLTVSIPMGLLNVIGSLQNIESAEAGGDRFATAPSLAVNGIGTIAAGLFGSCFPTTIYIGHPGWKALGARAGYSIANGVFFTICFLFGLGPMLAAIIPIEAGAAIVMYIGIIITAQAFQATPRAHAPAVAIAIFPALGAMLVVTLSTYFDAASAPATLADLAAHPTPTTMYLPGILTLTGANSGWIVVTLILSATGAALIDRRFTAAAIWCGAAALLTIVGLIHAYRLEGNILHEHFIWQASPASAAVSTSPSTAAPPTFAFRAFPVAVGYALATLIFAVIAFLNNRKPSNPALKQTDQYNLPGSDYLSDTHVIPAISTEAPPTTDDLVQLEDEPESKPEATQQS